jgi:hypothetical protein
MGFFGVRGYKILSLYKYLRKFYWKKIKQLNDLRLNAVLPKSTL